MHQLIDKKNKIITYLLFLLMLSTISGKFVENQKTYSSTINLVNIEGLSNANILKLSNELNKGIACDYLNEKIMSYVL